MTLKELYEAIDGNYDSAVAVLRIEKLIDKHIRRLPGNSVFPELFEAAKTMDPAKLFESAHAVKGVCGNLGLLKLYEVVSELSEEFRPGNPRRMTDDQVREKIADAQGLYEKAVAGIKQYENAGM